VTNPKGVSKGIAKLVVDGVEVDSKGTIPFKGDGKAHKVEITLG
jgi:hypothetical protein